MGVLECAVYIWIPSVLGWLFNLIAANAPGAFGIVYYLMPVVIVFGWYWVGTRYARRISNPAAAILAGNSIGILSLLVYLWQEYLAADKISWLQELSQYFSSSLVLVTTRIVVPFSPQVDGVIQVSNTVIQILGVVLMLLPFVGGFFRERQKINQKD